MKVAREIWSKRLALLTAVLFFILFFIYGLKVYDEYGIFWDDPIERKSSLIAYEYMRPSLQEFKGTTVDFSGLEEFDTYRDRYYGTAMQIPMVYLEQRAGFSMPYHLIYLLRHLYVFVTFFIALIFFYFLCKKYTKSDWLALLGTIFLISCPRILADSFYNIKDIMGLSLSVINTFFAIRFLEKEKWLDGIFLALSSALLINTRIVGGIVIAFCLLFELVKNWRNLKKCVCIGLLALGFYIFISPVTWKNPIVEIINTLRTFSSFANYEGPVLFMGKYYKTTELPWYYLPTWIFISMPVYLLMLFAIGNYGYIKEVVIKFKKEKEWELLLPFLFWIPLLFSVIFSPVMYNGWRHFYFICPWMILFSVLGVKYQLEKWKDTNWLRNILVACIAIGLFGTGAWIVENHPYEYVYFNPLVRQMVEGKFEKDYWVVSQFDLFQKLCDIDARDKIKVWCQPGTESSRYFLSDANQNRLEIVDNQVEADWVIHMYVGAPENEAFTMEHMFEPKESIVVDGVTLGALFKRKYDVRYQTKIKDNKSQIGAMSWKKEVSVNGKYLIGKLSNPVLTNLIWVQGTEDTDVEVSSDGVHWILSEKSLSGAQQFPKMELSYIRWKTLEVEEKEYKVQIYQLMEDVSEIAFLGNLKIENISDNFEEAYYMLDQKNTTRWSSGTNQYKGMYMSLLLEDESTISGLYLSLMESPWDYPRKLEIYTSADGKKWTKRDSETTDNEWFVFSPVTCKHLIIKLQEKAESYWSVYELELYQEIE